jgi:hypothetical protein
VRITYQPGLESDSDDFGAFIPTDAPTEFRFENYVEKYQMGGQTNPTPQPPPVEILEFIESIPNYGCSGLSGITLTTHGLALNQKVSRKFPITGAVKQDDAIATIEVGVLPITVRPGEGE